MGMLTRRLSARSAILLARTTPQRACITAACLQSMRSTVRPRTLSAAEAEENLIAHTLALVHTARLEVRQSCTTRRGPFQSGTTQPQLRCRLCALTQMQARCATQHKQLHLRLRVFPQITFLSAHGFTCAHVCCTMPMHGHAEQPVHALADLTPRTCRTPR